MSILEQTFLYPISFLVVISVVIVIHELGHYWAAKRVGAAVESFAFGFGGSIWERKDKSGTRWRVNWAPVGGFVSFIDEHNRDEVRKAQGQLPDGKSYDELTPREKTIISIAGPVANFLLAILVFACLGMAFGDRKEQFTVASVVEGSAAEKAGIEIGDVFLSINGQPADLRREFLQKIRLSANDPVDFGILRDDEELLVTAVIQREEVTDASGIRQRAGQLGVSFTAEIVDPNKLNPLQAVGYGVDMSAFAASSSLKMLTRIVTGKESIDQLSGPLGIANVVGTTAKRSLEVDEIPLMERLRVLFIRMIEMIAFISVAVGFFNLIPLPILDGGRIVFHAYEAVTGRPPSEQIQAMSMSLTLVFLVIMTLFITVSDFQETGLLEVFRGL